MRILEVGSGGYNAALLAEIVGPTGHVTTVDIDPDVTDRAATSLDAAGYGSRVRVLQADAYHGIPDESSFDVILVTVQCWDLAPAWRAQLAPSGVLVLPLTLNGVSRSIAFRRDGGRWVSHDAQMCGFVDLQGVGQRTEHRLTLNGDDGTPVVVAFDPAMPVGLHLDPNVLTTVPADVWSGVAFPHATSWADLYLYFACYLDGFCRLSTCDGRRYPVTGAKGFPMAVAVDDSIAYLTIRPLANPSDGVEFGAWGFGSHGHEAATRMVEQIRAWDASARAVQPWFSYMPNAVGAVRATPATMTLPKTHGAVMIHWQPAPSA